VAYPSLLCIHGAATGAWVWDLWRQYLKPFGWRVNVLDLRGHGRSVPVDFSEVTLEDYVSDVESVTPQIAAAEGAQPVICGWDMGGLIAMMYAARHPETPALALFAPSLPIEVAGRMPLDELRRVPSTPVGPEHFGVFPDDFEASRTVLFDLTDEEAQRVLQSTAGAQESGFAQRQRGRGISIPAGAIGAPAAVVYGETEPDPAPELNRRLAEHIGAKGIGVAGAGHWGVVMSENAVAATAPQLDGWLWEVLN
jgi:pimeloyl-ACP methyl ester carboxylesterase